MDRNQNRKRAARTAIAAGLGLTLLGLAAVSAQARGPGMGGPDPDRAVARLTERPDLTAEQKDQVKKILEESFAKHRELREEGRTKMEAARDETDTKLSQVLSAEQMEKLRQTREDSGGCGEGPGRRHRGEGRPR